MKRKAQISGQIFLYIFAMIVASAILIFGYKAVKMLTEKGNEAEMLTFQNKLKEDITYSKGYGTEKVNLIYMLPSEFTALCFVDLDPSIQNVETRITDKLIIRDSVRDKIAKNIFIYPSGEKSFYVDNLAVKDGYQCFTALKGRLKIPKMIGCGDKTLISDLTTDTSDTMIENPPNSGLQTPLCGTS